MARSPKRDSWPEPPQVKPFTAEELQRTPAWAPLPDPMTALQEAAASTAALLQPQPDALPQTGSRSGPLTDDWVRGIARDVVQRELDGAIDKAEAFIRGLTKTVVREELARLGKVPIGAALPEQGEHYTLSSSNPYPAPFQAVPLDGLWAERLTRMAANAGQSPAQYVEALLKRQWAAGAGVAKQPGT